MSNPFSRNEYEQGPVVIQPQGNPQHVAPPSSGAMGIQFSPEELQVLQECEMESLVQRSLPMGTLLGVTTYAAIQRGFLTTSTRFGAMPKVAAAVFFGYFLGKLSYQSICAEKIMRLPNSQLADALRRKRKGEFFESFNSDGGLSLAPFSSSTDVYTDENMKSHKQNSLDLDVDRPVNFGLDDTYRPNMDTPDRSFNDDLPLEPPKSSVSYEELRRRNREEHDRRMQQPFARPLPRDETPIVNRPLQERDESMPSGLKNKYGDVWK